MWIKEKDKEGLIRETEMLPERDNEEATEDKIKGREGERGAYRELGEDRE